MRRLICAFLVTNHRRQFFSVVVQLISVPFYHERLKSKMRDLIFVKYDITQAEMLFAQSLQSICSVYVDTPRVILLVTVFFIILFDIRKLTWQSLNCINHVLPIRKTLGENEEFSKLKTTKLFYFTGDSSLIFQS